MSTTNTINASKLVVNGITYVPEGSQKEDLRGDVKIVILQRGFVMVGKLVKVGTQCKLYNAKIIRRWGTTQGLGELAAKGKLKETILDDCNGVVEFHELTVIATIDCDQSKWA